MAAKKASSKPASQDSGASPDKKVQFRDVQWLTTLGVIAIIMIFILTLFALYILPTLVVAIITFAGGAIGIIGTFIGTQTGYLLGSSGKEHADRRTDDAQKALVKTLQDTSESKNEGLDAFAKTLDIMLKQARADREQWEKGGDHDE